MIAQNVKVMDGLEPDPIGAGVPWEVRVADITFLSLARTIHHYRGASLCIRHHSTFASFTNTGNIRSVTQSNVMSNPYAIHSRSGEFSRLGIY